MPHSSSWLTQTGGGRDYDANIRMSRRQDTLIDFLIYDSCNFAEAWAITSLKSASGWDERA